MANICTKYTTKPQLISTSLAIFLAFK